MKSVHFSIFRVARIAVVVAVTVSIVATKQAIVFDTTKKFFEETTKHFQTLPPAVEVIVGVFYVGNLNN
ncbi:2606_t:CDS:2 [Funneliformis caledonium]|uniref:2606_t:CDS:1 n=1 Tax=Funneliformis caledonium TaxID=1117310 RepID=A0A9N9DCQ3_9GLOM|nr:2606_t:CDS:2 [Funneliformis caledonium]